MTLAGGIGANRQRTPGESTEEEKLRWLSQVDGQWYREMVLTHEGAEETTFAPYTTDGDKSVALLIAPPYDEVYIPFSVHADGSAAGGDRPLQQRRGAVQPGHAGGAAGLQPGAHALAGKQIAKHFPNIRSA